MGTFSLFASLVFSAFLIVRDCRRRKSVSHAVWIPTILLMILGSRAVSLWLSGHGAHLGVEMANDATTSSSDQLFYASVLLSSLIVASLRGMKWKQLLAGNPAIMLFYLYFAVSILWSSDPTGSTKRIIKDFGLLFVVGVICTEKDPLQAMRAVYLRCAYLLLPLSIVFIRYIPDLGRAYGEGGDAMLTGVTTQKNSLGEIVMIFTMFMLWELFETVPNWRKLKLSRVPWSLLLVMLLGFWLLRLSQSKTSLLCTVVSTLLILRGRRFMSKTINHAVLAAALSLPFLLFFSQQFSSVVAPLIQALGRNMTFTGRTEIWQHITLKTVNPLIGAGYWNFWGGPGGYAVNLEMHSVIPNAHDGYVDLYLDGGFIGLGFLFVMLLSQGRRIIRRIKPGGDLNRRNRVRLAVLVAAIIFNLSESTFARIGPIWFTTLLMMVDYPSLEAVRSRARTAIKRGKSAITNSPLPTLVNQ